MERYFNIDDELSIALHRRSDNKFELTIEADYCHSMRKSQIYIGKETIEEIKNNLLRCWKNTKTKKLKSVSFYFEEIDWYDNLVDIYTTPTFFMERGKKKPKVGYQQHGSIPKDWSVKLSFTFETTTKITPFMEVINNFFNVNFDKEEKKRLEKMLRNVLKDKIGFGVYIKQ